MNERYREQSKKVKEPTVKGSYKQEDCFFLLKEIQENIEEDVETKEIKIQQGIHYSEMLPTESFPSQEYLALFHESLNVHAKTIARYVATLAEMIIKDKGKHVSLVSLARAGTPIGVLVKRYLKFAYRIDVPHYSVSIIRGKGVDENALLYILKKQGHDNLQFIDGWTGKGTIGGVLQESILSFNKIYDTNISSDLAVLSDPAHSAELWATREDFFLPSACLNSLVSGLISRTVQRDDLTGPHDFHAAKVYQEWEKEDCSNDFIEKIIPYFQKNNGNFISVDKTVTHQGWREMQSIQEQFGLKSINSIKPGIGETTRVLLRRVPEKILVKEWDNPSIQHILLLAKEKNVPVELYKAMSYGCIGIIKEKN